MTRLMIVIGLLLAFPGPSVGVRAEDIPLVAAASNLSHALDEIVAAYQAETHAQVRVSFGSSGNFTRQILQGAPFNLFLSADQKYLDMLRAEDHPVVASSILARGRIGFFIPRGSGLSELDMQGIQQALQHGQYRRIALANPDFAPYGVAAMQALQSAGVWVLEQNKLLLGESAAQTMQFSLSGGVDLGVIPSSYAGLPEIALKGEFLLIPETWHQPLLQYRVLLTDTAAARRFYEYLRSPTALGIMKAHGYETETEDAAETGQASSLSSETPNKLTRAQRQVTSEPVITDQ